MKEFTRPEHDGTPPAEASGPSGGDGHAGLAPREVRESPPVRPQPSEPGRTAEGSKVRRPRRRGYGWLVVLALFAGAAGWAALEGQRVWAAVGEARKAHQAYLDRVDENFRALTPLSDAETALLRRSLNPAHVAAGRAHGIAPIGARADLDSAAVAAGLVELRSGPGYTVWRGRYSVPYLTPDAAAALDTLAVRFERRMNAAGLPAMRFTVSSVLRSSEDQAALRRVNANAAAGTSSHEFGTTFDLPYRRFGYAGAAGPPPPPLPEGIPALFRLPLELALEAERTEAFGRFAGRYPTILAAELGRTLIELEDEGVLLTVREVQQPVYHTTLARPLAAE